MKGRIPDPMSDAEPPEVQCARYIDAVQMVRIREEMHGCESVRIERRISGETGLPVYRATFQFPPHELHIPQWVRLQAQASWMGNEALIADLNYLKESLYLTIRLAVDAAVDRLWERRNETGGEGR